MRIIRIIFFTLIAGFLGFIIGYILFARYADDYIPLKSIFMGTIADDGILNSVMNLRLKVSATAGAFAFVGLLIIVIVEFGGRRSAKSAAGFYECKYCGFKADSKSAFCIACERDENGLTKADYMKKAAEKLAAKN